MNDIISLAYEFQRWIRREFFPHGKMSVVFEFSDESDMCRARRNAVRQLTRLTHGGVGDSSALYTDDPIEIAGIKFNFIHKP